MNKKKVSDSSIALIYSLIFILISTAFIWFSSFIFFRILSAGVFNEGISYFLFVIIPFIVSLIGNWLGVVCSSRYVKNRYLIVDVARIIKLSIVYYIMLDLLYLIIMATKSGFQAFSGIGGLGFSILIFFFFSKKYLRNAVEVEKDLIK